MVIGVCCGILVCSWVVFEELCDVDVVLFDKIGMLIIGM